MNNTNYFCKLKCLRTDDFFIKFLSFTSVTLSISRLILSFSFSKDKNFSCVVTYLFCSLFHSSSIKMNLSSLFNFIFTFSHGFFRYVCSEQNCLFIPLFSLTLILDSSNRYDQVGGGGGGILANIYLVFLPPLFYDHISMWMYGTQAIPPNMTNMLLAIYPCMTLLEMISYCLIV